MICHREQAATLCRVLRVCWPPAAHKLMLSRFERCVYLGVYLATMPSIPAIKLMYFFAHESITRFPSLRDSRNVLCIFFLFVVSRRGWAASPPSPFPPLIFLAFPSFARVLRKPRSSKIQNKLEQILSIRIESYIKRDSFEK